MNKNTIANILFWFGIILLWKSIFSYLEEFDIIIQLVAVVPITMTALFMYYRKDLENTSLIKKEEEAEQ